MRSRGHPRSKTSSATTTPDRSVGAMTMQRITKPTPKRTRPLRNVGAAVRSSAKANGKSREPAIARGVELGYQLIDEYLDAGRSAAASMRRASPELSDAERLAQRLV